MSVEAKDIGYTFPQSFDEFQKELQELRDRKNASMLPSIVPGNLERIKAEARRLMQIKWRDKKRREVGEIMTSPYEILRVRDRMLNALRIYKEHTRQLAAIPAQIFSMPDMMQEDVFRMQRMERVERLVQREIDFATARKLFLEQPEKFRQVEHAFRMLDRLQRDLAGFLGENDMELDQGDGQDIPAEVRKIIGHKYSAAIAEAIHTIHTMVGKQ